MEPISLTNNKQTEADKAKQKEIRQAGPLPEHIAVIMDGNGRWAKKKGNIRVFGHKAGVESVRDITESCAQLGVGHLTLFAFSTENWGRPSAEINALIKLLMSTLRKEADNLDKNNIRLTAIGQLDRFPLECRELLQQVIDRTRDNDRMDLCLALSYSGRWDIAEATKIIGHRIKKGEIEPDEVNKEMIAANMSTAGNPDPDLVIRTSGEFRISNFFLWQLAYTELYITETFWPDFRRDELYNAIISFQNRDRRYGKIDNHSQTQSRVPSNEVVSHINS